MVRRDVDVSVGHVHGVTRGCVIPRSHALATRNLKFTSAKCFISTEILRRYAAQNDTPVCCDQRRTWRIADRVAGRAALSVRRVDRRGVGLRNDLAAQKRDDRQVTLVDRGPGGLPHRPGDLDTRFESHCLRSE